MKDPLTRQRVFHLKGIYIKLANLLENLEFGSKDPHPEPLQLMEKARQSFSRPSVPLVLTRDNSTYIDIEKITSLGMSQFGLYLICQRITLCSFKS
jgi:hypothetical protein